MKILYFLMLLAISFSTAMADVIMTTDRKIYYDVDFGKIDATGIQILHRDGVVKLTPSQFSDTSRRKYAYQIAKYESVVKKQNNHIQLEVNKRIQSLKKLPVAERLSGYADLRIRYSTGKFKWTKLDFSVWEQEVTDSQREFDEKVMEMEIIDAVRYASELQSKFAQLNFLANEFNTINNKMIAIAAADLPQIEEDLKKLKSAQRLKVAQILLKNLEKNSEKTGNLKTIIVNARGDLEFSNAIKRFKNSKFHNDAVKNLTTLIARYPNHPDLSQIEEIKDYHVRCLQAQEDFDFLKSNFDPARAADFFRVMDKALKVYADTPYISLGRASLKEMKNKQSAYKLKMEMERAAAERARREQEYRAELIRNNICISCKGKGYITWNTTIGTFNDHCPSCQGTGRYRY